ncbi:MAG: hypothetical protein EXS29_05655 [Pedosphaera sp.]|nr:hypothetical protein [Pedosphaera sp.]
MTFLQPFILWGLPLILLPVLIHLFNRLRHRPMPWAAMQFLRSATRKSTRYAKLRQLLVLLFRVLAVLAFILALSRPLAGGWAGGVMGGAPDVVLLLLDRSASMEMKDSGNQQTKRETAIKALVDAARGLEEKSRFVLIDSATKSPQELVGTATLAELSLAAPTDTAADLPSLLQGALDWLAQNKPGSTEIWIASDLQRSNWQPESDRWPALASGLAALPQNVRVRLLALNKEAEANTSVALREVTRHIRGTGAELELVIELERNSISAAPVPLVFNIGGVQSQVELKLDGQSLRYRHRILLEDKNASGFGHVDLPVDANLRDNRAYFIHNPPPLLRVAVVGSDLQSTRMLQFAAAPDRKNTNQVSEVLRADALAKVEWKDYAAVLWQAKLPEGDTAKQLQTFAEAGGVVLFLPSGDAGKFGDQGWGELQNAGVDKDYPIARWEEKDGPLAKTDEGLSLPLDELVIIRRQSITGDAVLLATFADGAPLLTRRNVGKGQVLFCATLPNLDWSDLHDGGVLVPMLQRVVQSGGRRFTQGSLLACGDLPARSNERWEPVVSGGGASADARLHSGVFRVANQIVAVNRPAREDDSEVLEATKTKELFAGVPVQLFEEKDGAADKKQTEIWRLLLAGMLLFLVVEGILILPEPNASAARAAAPTGATAAFTNA